MADNEIKTGKKKPHPAIFVGVIVLILLVLGFAQFVSRHHDSQSNMESAQQASEQETAAPAEPPQTEENAATPAEQTANETPSTDVTSTPASVSVDVNAALSDRILGDPSAPVRIAEHASLTCPHCGDFHRDTFDKIKKEYVDTKKAYFVFSDFPLNEPALRASMIARCLPESKYFDFIHMLFVKQEEWAISPKYMDFLETEAAKNGLDKAHAEACVANKEIENGIMNRMKGVQQQWNINSTPSFVFNNTNTVSGSLPYEEFKKQIDAALSKQQSNAQKPAPVVKQPVEEKKPEEKTPAAAAPAPAESPKTEAAPTTAPAADEGVTDEPAPPSDEGADTESEDSGKTPAQ